MKHRCILVTPASVSSSGVTSCVCLHLSVFSPAACNCHRHSFDCYYDPEVDERRASLDIHGHYRGGGVCLNCQVPDTPETVLVCDL